MMEQLQHPLFCVGSGAGSSLALRLPTPGLEGSSPSAAVLLAKGDSGICRLRKRHKSAHGYAKVKEHEDLPQIPDTQLWVAETHERNPAASNLVSNLKFGLHTGLNVGQGLYLPRRLFPDTALCRGESARALGRGTAERCGRGNGWLGIAPLLIELLACRSLFYLKQSSSER